MKPQLRPGCTVSDDGVSIRSRSAIDEMIVRLDQAGEGFRIPVLRAARDGLINLLLVPRGEHVPARALKFRMPTLLVLLDDAPEADGPDRWPQARKLLRWAGGAVFHASGGLPEHYALAAVMAGIHGRALLVEMEFRHHAAWLQLATRTVPRLPILNIVPAVGNHPIAGAPAGGAVQ